ncbi:hypothetical protein NPIL_319591 [Nephila pilipes]|uniref:Uncharacterized protein n=1 Tax=Nephila pilipes TaxID=299642 RepID=A0A8X6PK14_NEPPI|nr:hypothetical protein NPIL_319591 [Nephila pilipes]
MILRRQSTDDSETTTNTVRRKRPLHHRRLGRMLLQLTETRVRQNAPRLVDVIEQVATYAGPKKLTAATRSPMDHYARAELGVHMLSSLQ